MSISEYNYEAYFLDYHEGRLDDAATKELMDFVARHPELQREFESFESISLNDAAEDIKFENKESLKRSAAQVNASTFEDIAIQYIEGTLNPVLSDELLQFVKQNPRFENELALYKKTKLVADTSIFFEDKESLKRSARRPAYYYWSAAASIALLIAAYLFINSNKNTPGVTIASVNKVDTNHAAQTASNTVSITHTNPDSIVPVKNSTEPKTNNVAVSQVNHFVIAKHIPAPQAKDSTVNIAQQKPVIQYRDSSIGQVNPVIAITQKDTVDNISVAQQPVHYYAKESIPATATNSKSVFALAANTVKSIGNFFKHGIGINSYYSKKSDKVIAYQITFGDNRYTLPIRNSSY